MIRCSYKLLAVSFCFSNGVEVEWRDRRENVMNAASVFTGILSDLEPICGYFGVIKANRDKSLWVDCECEEVWCQGAK